MAELGFKPGPVGGSAGLQVTPSFPSHKRWNSSSIAKPWCCWTSYSIHMWVSEGERKGYRRERDTALGNSFAAPTGWPHTGYLRAGLVGWAAGRQPAPFLCVVSVSSVIPLLRERYSAEHCMMSRSYTGIFFLSTNVTLFISCFNLLLVPTWPPGSPG